MLLYTPVSSLDNPKDLLERDSEFKQLRQQNNGLLSIITEMDLQYGDKIKLVFGPGPGMYVCAGKYAGFSNLGGNYLRMIQEANGISELNGFKFESLSDIIPLK